MNHQALYVKIDQSEDVTLKVISCFELSTLAQLTCLMLQLSLKILNK